MKEQLKCENKILTTNGTIKTCGNILPFRMSEALISQPIGLTEGSGSTLHCRKCKCNTLIKPSGNVKTHTAYAF